MRLCSLVWSGLAWPGLVCFSLVCFVLAWSWLGPAGFGLFWFCPGLSFPCAPRVSSSLVGVRRCQRSLSQTQSYCLIDTGLTTDAIVYVLSCAYGLHGWLRPLTWGGVSLRLRCLVWSGLAWPGLVMFGLIRFSLACCCLAWSVFVWPGLSLLQFVLIWLGSFRSGLAWFRLF